jgi:hypothetical protein
MRFLRKTLRSVQISEDNLRTEIDRLALKTNFLGESKGPDHSAQSKDLICLVSPLEIRRRGSEVRLVLSAGEIIREQPSLIHAIARARDWADKIIAGELSTLSEIVRLSGLDRHYAARLLQCVALSPRFVANVLTGYQPAELTVAGMTENVTLDWESQL